MNKKLNLTLNRQISGILSGLSCLFFSFIISMFLASQANAYPLSNVTSEYKATVEGVDFAFSYTGQIDGMNCVSVNESADPHGWGDNYICSSQNIGMQWSVAGSIPNMDCTQINESADPYAWTDNYLCLPTNSNFAFIFSNGTTDDDNKVSWNEPADPHFWGDNYLTILQSEYKASAGGVDFAFSHDGQIGGMNCVSVNESADPDGWGDNYFCTSQDLGMQWSDAGAIPNMKCIQINESADPYNWADNYLCLPTNSNFKFEFSITAIEGNDNVSWNEPEDPHPWGDNYLTIM